MIHLIKGDITKFEGDTIVNAANSSLLGGGGVDGAIHRAAGAELLKECKTLGGCKTGEAKLSKAYNLPCKYIIHTVGPIYHGGTKGEPQALKNCYQNSLKLALQHNLKSIAFPNISTGVYGYPKKEAADIALRTLQDFLSEHPHMEVTFYCFDDENYQLYQKKLGI